MATFKAKDLLFGSVNEGRVGSLYFPTGRIRLCHPSGPEFSDKSDYDEIYRWAVPPNLDVNEIWDDVTYYEIDDNENIIFNKRGHPIYWLDYDGFIGILNNRAFRLDNDKPLNFRFDDGVKLYELFLKRDANNNVISMSRHPSRGGPSPLRANNIRLTDDVIKEMEELCLNLEQTNVSEIYKKLRRRRNKLTEEEMEKYKHAEAVLSEYSFILLSILISRGIAILCDKDFDDRDDSSRPPTINQEYFRVMDLNDYGDDFEIDFQIYDEEGPLIDFKNSTNEVFNNFIWSESYTMSEEDKQKLKQRTMELFGEDFFVPFSSKEKVERKPEYISDLSDLIKGLNGLITKLENKL